MKCDRCSKDAICSTMSRFNTDEICMECERKERAHPEYPEAEKAELEAMSDGDWNFPGIGKPADL